MWRLVAPEVRQTGVLGDGNLSLDDAEIAILLMEGGTQRDEAIRRIHEDCHRRVYKSLRLKFPGVAAEELRDCYAEAMLQFVEILRKYDSTPALSSFDPDKPVYPLIREIAHRRAIDRLRANNREREYLETMGTKLATTDIGFYWQGIPTHVRDEIRRAVQIAIAELPPKERLVWGVFVEEMITSGERPSDDGLYKLVFARAGPSHTFVSVKRALANGRATVRKILEAKGFRGDEYWR
jgi:RNA polymerase sigma factor (sigma-70 family)